MTRRRYRIAILGGTFDRLHAGHRTLLRAAFASADEVRIGVTTAAYLTAHPKPYARSIESFPARCAALRVHLTRTYPGRRFRLLPLRDPFGRSLELGPELLVVSEQTRRGAEAVNRERRRLGRPPLAVRVVRMRRDRSGRIYRSRNLRRTAQPPPAPPANP